MADKPPELSAFKLLLSTNHHTDLFLDSSILFQRQFCSYQKYTTLIPHIFNVSLEARLYRCPIFLLFKNEDGFRNLRVSCFHFCIFPCYLELACQFLQTINVGYYLDFILIGIASNFGKVDIFFPLSFLPSGVLHSPG